MVNFLTVLAIAILAGTAASVVLHQLTSGGYSDMIGTKYQIGDIYKAIAENDLEELNSKRKENEMPLPSTKYIPPTPQQVATKARQIAVELGRKQSSVNADQVYAELEKAGYPANLLGSAAGSIFSKKLFTKAAFNTQSTRQSNRGRRINVWYYIGE
jgi:hypothetical protein